MTDNVPIISCVAKGKRCTAMDKAKVKWTHDALSEAEAVMLTEAVTDRGYILPEWWHKVDR